MNRLQFEKSPYLQQHKSNPVDWFPWGREAFEKAKELNLPIFLSIGYSTCYWCHVMEKDSFETPEVGEALKNGFIAIKVDREERPDVDELYMDAIVSLTGHGGWPMSVFLTPDLKPFWGGTYFPKAQFLQILKQIKDTWINHPEDVLSSSEKLTSHLREKKDLPDGQNISVSQSEEILWDQLKERLDPVWGGFGRAPKFPPSQQIAALLRMYQRTKSPEIEGAINLTLKGMAWGGIFDHAAGGFSRYSVDERWSVPHFEKMLYDNSLLASVYLEAAQALQNSTYSNIAREVLEYLIETMKSPIGGFYAAEDAGEVGREGEFYVWKWNELNEILSKEEFETIQKSYLIKEGGNFEHGNNVLHFSSESNWEGRYNSQLSAALTKLKAYREKTRERPHRDEKIIASWNGFALLAFVKAYEIFNDKKYLSVAQGIADCIQKHLIKDKKLFRSYCDGVAAHQGCLEDYASVSLGLLRFFEVSGNIKALEDSIMLSRQIEILFFDKDAPGYFTSSAEELVIRNKEFFDGATPSGNSLALELFARLGVLYPEEDFSNLYLRLKKGFSKILEAYPSGAPRALQAVQLFEGNPHVLVYVEAAKAEYLNEQKASFQPNIIAIQASESGPPVGRGKNDGRYFLCSQGACKLPTTTLTDLKAQLDLI